MNFNLYYKPESTKNYEFEIPFILKGYGIFDGIKRRVKCKGDRKPEFVI